MSDDRKKSCIVVGAGISGLLAADALHREGYDLTVLDKGRGVGGRMATRRVGGGTFDHGDWTLEPEPEAVARILRRHAEVFALLENGPAR